MAMTLTVVLPALDSIATGAASGRAAGEAPPQAANAVLTSKRPAKTRTLVTILSSTLELTLVAD